MKCLPLLLVPFAIGMMLLETSRGCAPVMPKGGHAQIADESAIIIWDAKTKKQHFIRRATFLTEAENLGFLVPTPTKPEVAEANDDAFKHLESVTAPRVVEQTRKRGRYGKDYGATKMSAPAGGSMATVRVLGEGRVGHLDYAILAANRPEELNQWLKKHEYASRPELSAWLKQYLDKKWIITAFKFARDAKPIGPVQGMTTSALRMSFSTDRPFYPYSEPEDQRSPRFGGTEPRLLRVYFIGDTPVQGALADGNYWPSNVAWANHLASHQQEALLDHLKLPHTAAPASAWLTEFEDPSSPRQGTADIFFTNNPSLGTVERTPIIKEIEPPPPNPAHSLGIVGGIAGGIVLLLILGSLAFWRKDPQPLAA